MKEEKSLAHVPPSFQSSEERDLLLQNEDVTEYIKRKKSNITVPIYIIFKKFKKGRGNMVYVEEHNEHQSNILMCFSQEIRNRLGLSLLVLSSS